MSIPVAKPRPLSPLRGQRPPSVAIATSPSDRRESFLKGRATGVSDRLPVIEQSFHFRKRVGLAV